MVFEIKRSYLHKLVIARCNYLKAQTDRNWDIFYDGIYRSKELDTKGYIQDAIYNTINDATKLNVANETNILVIEKILTLYGIAIK